MEKKEQKPKKGGLFACFGGSRSSKGTTTKLPQTTIKKDFASCVLNRRTYYAISKDVKASDARIEEIVKFAVTWAPSSFNSQSGRAVLLLGKHHDKFWDNTKEILRKMLAPERFGDTEKKMDSFKAGYGTVLFFEDQDPVKGMQEKFPSYAENFPKWSEHSSGMIQYIVWCGLESEGLGCSLQHYAPLVDESVQQEWGVPTHWKLIAQMPFGQPTGQPGPKEFQPISERVKEYK